MTGATGLIGQQVLHHLGNAADKITVIGRGPNRSIGRVSYIQGDLLNFGELERQIHQLEATHLLHLAWITDHGAYWASEDNMRWRDTTERLAIAFCEAGGKRIVAAGSCAEYAPHTHPIAEDGQVDCSSHFSRYRNETRQLLFELTERFPVDVLYGRVFFAYGPGEDRRRIIPSLIDHFNDTHPAFPVSLNDARDFIHSSDVARAFKLMLGHGECGTYNICSGTPVSIDELVETIARLSGSDPGTIRSISKHQLSPEAEKSVICGDPMKLNQLAFSPKISLEEGLSRYITERRARKSARDHRQ